MMNQPPDFMNLPQGTPYVTKLKSKILFRMDYVLQCQDDEAALNGWRLLCADGVMMVRLALEAGMLDDLNNSQIWKDLAEKIIGMWPLKTAEKTSVVRETEGYRCNYDHYSVEVRTYDLELGLRSLEREKYNVINSTLASIWGDCYAIAMAVGFLDLEEEIEIPVQTGDQYTKDKMRKGFGRYTPIDGQGRDSQAQDVEGRANRK